MTEHSTRISPLRVTQLLSQFVGKRLEKGWGNCPLHTRWVLRVLQTQPELSTMVHVLEDWSVANRISGGDYIYLA